MPILYINTEKLSDNLFEFYQQKVVGFDLTVHSEERECNSRIEACLLNTGLACKYLIENYNTYDTLIEKTIALLDDRETSSEREQYEIYKICQGLKYGKIEGNLYQFELRFGKELEQWLARIVYYIKLGNINIKLYYMRNNEFCLEERQLKTFSNQKRNIDNKVNSLVNRRG